VTVHQIAKLANVSAATVSRVLNSPETVRPETAEAVRRVIQQNGNGANALLVRRGPRQGLRPRRNHVSHTIAIVSIGQAAEPWFQKPVLANVIAGITREAKERGLVVQIEEAETAGQAGALLRSRGVGGVLTFLSAWSDPDSLQALNRHVPVVRVMGEASASGVDHVCPDNLAVGGIAFDYLMAAGCRNVAFLTANPGWDLIFTRAYGFVSHALRCGAAEAPTAFVVTNKPTERELYGVRTVTRATLEDLVDAFIQTTPRPAGLFVPRDEETVAVYRLLAARGMRVGRDVTVISCDNEDMRLSALDPRPASIELGTVEIGRLAVRRLLSRMRRPHEPAVKIQSSPRLAAANSASVNGDVNLEHIANANGNGIGLRLNVREPRTVA
jgi:DNA-binding LacI/PurR family transcriptional regulator